MTKANESRKAAIRKAPRGTTIGSVLGAMTTRLGRGGLPRDRYGSVPAFDVGSADAAIIVADPDAQDQVAPVRTALTEAEPLSVEVRDGTIVVGSARGEAPVRATSGAALPAQDSAESAPEPGTAAKTGRRGGGRRRK